MIKLPSELQNRVKNELKRDEIVVWTGQPDPVKFMKSGFTAWVFFIPWTTFSIFWLASASGFRVPDFSNVATILFTLFGLPFLLIGIHGLNSPVRLKNEAKKWNKLPMLARTHGQPASPTTLGKEIYVFVDRINQQMKLLRKIPFSAKFSGSVGNFNAHYIAYENIDWIKFSNNFVNKILGLNRSEITSQIDHYDSLSTLFEIGRASCRERV